MNTYLNDVLILSSSDEGPPNFDSEELLNDDMIACKLYAVLELEDREGNSKKVIDFVIMNAH